MRRARRLRQSDCALLCSSTSSFQPALNGAVVWPHQRAPSRHRTTPYPISNSTAHTVSRHACPPPAPKPPSIPSTPNADPTARSLFHHTPQGELYIIDVSQSVDLDHPKALDFLREDCKHVNDYFRRAGVATLTVRETFDFVVDPAINDDNVDAALERLSDVAAR